MPIVTDQTGATLTLTRQPERIVSLVPSQTELLYDLGLADRVVGITKFCVHPESWFRSKPRVGGTKSLHIDLVRQLSPDLILANQEENDKQQVGALRNFCPVWTSRVTHMTDALHMIRQVGSLTDTGDAARKLAGDIQHAFSQLTVTSPAVPAAYLIWRNPYMTVGGDTFIHDMMSRAGFRNVFEDRNRYPEITIDMIRNSGARWLLLSSEPYPFNPEHAAELKIALPGLHCIPVDGELFSWYGSRMQYAPAYFRALRKHQTGLD